MIISSDFSDLYHELLEKVLCEGEAYAPRGMEVRELLNVSFTLDKPGDGRVVFKYLTDRQPIYDSYLEREHKWYLSGERTAESAPAEFWKTIADKDGNVNSNYGWIALHNPAYFLDRNMRTLVSAEDSAESEGMTALEAVVKIFKADPDSRQAIIHYNQPEHYFEGNKDVPCCLTNQFFIRNGKLHMIVHMRSTDAIKGLGYDCPWFCSLGAMVAASLGLPGLETLTYHMGSFHVYKKDIPLAHKIIGYRP